MDLAVLLALALPAILLLVAGLRGPRPQQPWAIFVRHFAGELETALARACLQLVLLASQATQMLNAVVVTLIRLATRRRLLVWETAAASTQRGGRPGAAAMIATTATALGGAVVVALTRPTALPVALPVLALWLASPGLAWLLSRPARTRTAELGERDRRELQRIARKTWHYFEELAGAEHHGLPPDNLQEVPDRRVAHRTSPTNIGMGLLATLAAHDLDFVDDRRAPRAHGRRADHHRGARAPRGPPVQLVRHSRAGTARAALCLDRRQRQPGRLVDHTRRGPP
jgi:cyclic beta-1,2-glucan synthetase